MASRLDQYQGDLLSKNPETEFALSLDGYEGPIDLLLELVREKGFDLNSISITQLAEQYLRFLAKVPPEQLQRAADYLVMASWLAMLKSKLLLPKDELDLEEEDPSLMAERLAERLRQLEGMQKAARALRDLPQLGKDFFIAGHAGDKVSVTRTEYPADLAGLVLAFRRVQEKVRHRRMRLRISELPVISVEDARSHLVHIAGTLQDWRPIRSVLPPPPEAQPLRREDQPLMQKSRLASTFMASLEMEREGKLALKQDRFEKEISLRKASS